jgi:hypothetical protein
MVYVKARTRCQLQNETYVPISKFSVNFDNFSNLCANMTQYELYMCSVAAGLDMDYQTWRGYSTCSRGSSLTQNNGCVSSGNTSNSGVMVGNIYNIVQGGSGPSSYTWQIIYQQANSYTPALVNGQYVNISGNGGAVQPLNGTFVVSNVGSIATGTWSFNVAAGSIAPGTGGNSYGFITLGGGQGGSLSSPTVLPVISTTSGIGGSYVPYALSSTSTDLWTTSGGAYNVAGQNKFVPRPSTQLTGGPLMMRMGQDIALSPGLAPGSLGNFSVQINLTLDNSQHFFDAYSSYQMVIIAVTSGYLETVRGQSAVRRTILNMADVESATVASGVSTVEMRRLVGGARGHGLSGIAPYVRSGVKQKALALHGHRGDMAKRPREESSGL